MPEILTRGTSVYKCDVCARKIRVPKNDKGLEIVQRCIITKNCKGKLHPVLIESEINDTPTFPPEEAGIRDWTQRQVLFTFNQTISSSVWTVVHNLATNPIVNVYINQTVNGTTVQVRTTPKNINIIDNNTLEVVFDIPESGTVQCIALASKNTVNPSTIMAPTATTQQVTTNSVLSLAVLTIPGTVGIRFYSSASPTPVDIAYTTPQNVAGSPWNGKTVFINGKTYVVVDFDILTASPAPATFEAGLIADGSTLYIQNVTSIGQTLLLLANAPYTAADRIYDHYIDAININTVTPQLYYSGGDIFAQTSIVKNTYPPIIVVS